MNDIETLIALVAVAILLVRVADAISVPYPIVLVLGGLAIGFLPGGPSLELEPDVVFLVFLPPLLQSAGYWASPKELRAELLPLTWLVLGLTLATMVAVAAVAQAVIPEHQLGRGDRAGRDRLTHGPRLGDCNLRAGRDQAPGGEPGGGREHDQRRRRPGRLQGRPRGRR